MFTGYLNILCEMPVQNFCLFFCELTVFFKIDLKECMCESLYVGMYMYVCVFTHMFIDVYKCVCIYIYIVLISPFYYMYFKYLP